MAHASKRLSRRDIRRPDQFVTLTGRFFHFVTHYRTHFIAAAAAIIIILLGLWGWEAYGARQNRLAAREYGSALGLYHEGRYLQAVEAFVRLRSYSASPYSRLAILYQAKSYLALENPVKAAATLEELLQRERKETLLRQIGLLTLASLQERTGRCKEAVSRFAEAEKIAGPFKDDALLGKARCSLQNQDPKGALDSYRQYLTSYPGGDRVSEVSLKIQEIEAKIGPGSSGK